MCDGRSDAATGASRREVRREQSGLLKKSRRGSEDEAFPRSAGSLRSRASFLPSSDLKQEETAASCL